MALAEQGNSNWTVENLLRPVVIAAMMACLTAPLVYTLQALDLGYNGNYFLIFAFLASLEGILSERLLQRRRITGWAYLGSRLAEIILLLLLLKFSSYLSLGFDQLRSDAQTWLADPYRFVSTFDLFLSALFIVMWTGSLYVARMVMELDETEDRAPEPEDKTSVDYYMWLTRPPVIRDRQETLAWLMEVVLWGGVVLLAASAAVHFFVGSAQDLAVPMLLYFALGVALLTQARFSVVRAGWQVQGINVQPQVARRWLVWVVVFLVGVSLLALIFPTYYTLGPLQACLGVLSVVYAVVSFLFSLFFFLLMLPLALLLPNVETPVPPTFMPEALPAPEPAATSTQSQWGQALASAVFWLLVLAIVVYALVRFWRDRVGKSEDGDSEVGGLWQRFVAWLRSLWHRWWAWGQQVQDQWALRRDRRQAAGPPAGGLSRLFFPGRLPPRERVRFFYLSAARRAAQAGQPRRSGQTPYEYRASLDEQFPDLEPDLEGLTDAFIRARYSDQPVEQEDAAAAKPLWERVKAALRRRRT
jgi:hypothetical protein